MAEGVEKYETVHMVIWHGYVSNMGDMSTNWSMNIARLKLAEILLQDIRQNI